MENVAVEKKQTGETPSVARAMWDPFWFMHEMIGWGRSVGVPSFDVKETGDAYIYKVKLTVPGQADVARVKAEFNNGELTLVVPKASTSTPEPASPPSPRRTTGSRRGSAARTPRRRTRTR